MSESRIAATDRLRREGRWDEASIYRDQVRKRLRGEGIDRTEAGDRAWQEMLEKYPPLPESDPSSDISEDLEAHIWPDPGWSPPNLARDILWVYQNLVRQNVRSADAPGAGAWALLRWARQYRNRFFEVMLPKAMALSVSAPPQHEMRTDPAAQQARKEAAWVKLRELLGQPRME